MVGLPLAGEDGMCILAELLTEHLPMNRLSAGKRFKFVALL
jgi:hypothetical protein